MNVVEFALVAITRDLSSVGARWALIGGFAVSARAEPRFTRDVDLAVSVDSDAEAEAIVRALSTRGYGLEATVDQEYTRRLATVRLAGPGIASDVVVDLLFASSGIERETVAEAGTVEIIPGVVAPVAGVGDLIALKLLARDDAARPQDIADLNALKGVASGADLGRAEVLVRLIMDRGFNRGRDLVAELRRLTDR